MKKFLLLLTMLMVGAGLVFGQQRTITGKIIGDDGKPIPGATIQVKGTSTGTVSDENGNFKLNVPSGAILLVRAVGFASNEMPVGNAAQLTISLQAEVQAINEVVVTALGFQAQKDKLATSQSTVSGQALVRSGETSVLNALAGKASGVQVVRSGGDPGAGTYIQIRGQSTITGNLQPLVIIDGVPVSNSTLGQGVAGTTQQSRLSDVNPEDIQSMEILKGAAAAALWGTRAANGVVIITTKKGRASGKVNISLSSTYSIDELNKSVPLQTNYGQGINGRYVFGDRRSWGDKIADRKGGADNFLTSGDYVILPDGSKRYRIASGTNSNPHGGKNSKDVFDHSRELFRNGYYWDNTLTLSGGDDKSLYYVSLSNLDQVGTLKAGSDYQRKSFRVNADRRFGNVLKLSSNLNYVNVKSNRVQQGSNLSGIFLGGLRTSPDFDNKFYEGTYVDANGALYPKRQISYRNPIGANTNSGYDNPFWIINRITSNTTVNRLFGTFEATVDANSWLQFVERAGVDYYSDVRYDNFPSLSASYPGGQLTIQQISETQFNNDVIARANKQFSKNFGLTALVGFNYNNRYFENIGATVGNFILPDAPFDLGNSAGDARTPFNSRSTIRTTAMYSQLTLSLFDQLYLDLTGRGENSSTYAKTFYYPSASLGWQFTKLPGLRNQNGFSFGKLRVSYGEVGVQPSPYLAGTYYNPTVVGESYGPTLDASSAVYGGGYSRSTVQGNPNIKPERKKEFEVGADLRFWNDRISLSGTYYRNKTVDAIFSVQVPATTGFTTRNDNAASIENKGVELDMGVTWLKKGNATITTSANWSRNINKVLSLKGIESYFLAGFAGTSSRAVEGQPLGVLWSVDFEKDAKGKLVLDGNGFPKAGPRETVIGNPNPDWIGGLANTFRYKSLALSVLIDHVEGGDIWNGTKGALYTFGTHADVGNEATAPRDLKTYNGQVIAAGTKFRGAVKDFGAGPVALTQAWYTDLGGGFGPVASQFIEKGTRTRLREVALTYTLNMAKVAPRSRLQSIDFSVSGRNLALWTNYTGIDPETNLTGPSNGRGLDYFNNPGTRSYFFTIKVNY